MLDGLMARNSLSSEKSMSQVRSMWALTRKETTRNDYPLQRQFTYKSSVMLGGPIHGHCPSRNSN